MKNSSPPTDAGNSVSVRLLSPFRYPGGKTWLVPTVREWLASMMPKPVEFIEPFAGGAIVGLNVAFRQLADHVTLVELDEEVAAVWHCIIYGDVTHLANKIVTFNLTPNSVKEEFSRIPTSLEDKAFRVILRNRINRGGIMAAGAGMLRYGENGKGIKSRWYPETLKKRVLEIAKLREHITFIRGDGLRVLEQNANRANVVFFVDPPYTTGGKQAGKRLYSHYQLDHEQLFSIANKLTGDFLMTYSSDEKVRQLAQRHNFDMQEIEMKTSHHVKMTELLISRDLAWLR
ncbi:MAG: DNA methyltransferase [Chloroflexi bacterium RBG_16_57_9]|nr:MAG: DNA methyltransferase [Chloroflexi bacterium RBG_16_57_9]